MSDEIPSKAPFVRMAASLPDVPGTFTPDDVEALDPDHVTKLLNYLIQEHARKAQREEQRRNNSAVRAAIIFVMLVCLLVGAFAENVRSSLFANRIVDQLAAMQGSIDKNTQQLEKASSVDAILRTLNHGKMNVTDPR